jgi:hypothetical protein
MKRQIKKTESTELRDYEIKRMYKELRANKVKSYDAIEEINMLYPYLSFNSLQWIIGSRLGYSKEYRIRTKK